jgi:prepilin peptidase dependent protein B
MAITYHAQSGGLLSEFLLTMLLTAGLMAAIGQYLVSVARTQYQMQQQTQLRNEVQQLLIQLQKAIRRSGFCAGSSCTGAPVRIVSGSCLLLRWDKPKITAIETDVHPYNQGISFRLAHQQIQARSGVFNHCRGVGWENLTNPQLAKITLFRLSSTGNAVTLKINVEASKVNWQLTFQVYRKNSG